MAGYSRNIEGVEVELKLVEGLNKLGYKVRSGTPQDDRIDIDGYMWEDVGWTPVSIKCTTPPRVYNSLAFEVNKVYTNMVKPGWWYTSEAELYLFWLRDTKETGDVYWVDVNAAHDHVAKHGWDKTTKTNHFTNKKERELYKTKRHTELGILDLSTINKYGLGGLLWYIQ